MDFNDLVKEIVSLRATVETLKGQLARTATMENNGTGGGVTSVSGTPPIASTGGTTPALSLAATTTNDGGTVVKQAATPGTAQSGHINVNGTINGGAAVQVGGQNVNPVPKNYIINGNFDVCQRYGPLGSAVVPAAKTYVLDRFYTQRDGTGATLTVSQQAFTPGQTVVPGEPTYFLRAVQSVAGSGGTSNVIDHFIEDVRITAGQNATYSFYAKADSARTLTAQIYQNFGTGGSATVLAGSLSCNLTTTMQKFTLSLAMPSISGNTSGAGNAILLRLNLPLNTTFTVEVAQEQFEAGANASPFQKKSFAEELQACKRYYQKSFDYGQTPGPGIDNGRLYPPFLNFSGSTYYTWPLEVEMRVAPTTVNYYRPNAGTSANLAWNYNRANHATAMTTSVLTARRIEVAMGVNTGWALGDLIAFQYDASAEF
jgi:hypothetical protein